MENKVTKKLNKHLWTVVLCYFVFGACWIFFSDTLTHILFTTPQKYRTVQLYKGWFFIFITSTFLFLIIKRKNHAIKNLFSNVRKNMQNFRETFEQTAVGIAHVSVDRKWIRVNKKLCEILGYSRAELFKMPVYALVHPNDVQRGKTKDQKILDGRYKDYITEKRYVKKSGEVIYARLTKTAIKNKKGDIKYICGVLEDITKQKEAENELLHSLEEKKHLLAEIHHRVKNNLAVISGLIELQSFSSKNKVVKKILKQSLMRIKSIALIHESYYKSGSLADVHLDEYLEDFVEYVRRGFSESQAEVSLVYSTEPVSLNINQAIPCGLLLNELLINAYLHAFKQAEKGTISVKLTRDNNEITLKIADNGRGLPDSVDVQNPSSLGMTIVNTLVKQLNGSISVQRTNGTAFSITFIKKDKKGSSSNFTPNSTE